MQPYISVITLGVSDLTKAFAFYHDGLGFPSQGLSGSDADGGAIAFFDLDGGLKLALYSRPGLAEDAAVPAGPPSATEFTLAHNVASKAGVDQVMAQAQQAGATITDPAHDRFWGGYSGYFQDPDGHLWEVAWNPNL